MTSEHFPLNTPFKPSLQLITWFSVEAILTVGVFLLIFYLPFTAFSDVPLFVHEIVLGVIFVLLVLFLLWTRLYYASMFYQLREDELSWKRGVWFRATGIVPYNRITNIDIRQGPIMRWLKISTLSIQTAGYSGQAVPEIRIEAIVHAEELRELLRTMVRGHSGGDGTGTGPATSVSAPRSTDQQILDELRQIRVLLEKRS
ncbi:MAG: PH domain-containing protein [Methanoregulaceae archaeon]|nr:PH domain-containing protein [Methanoregulaceae archaeon]